MRKKLYFNCKLHTLPNISIRRDKNINKDGDYSNQVCQPQRTQNHTTPQSHIHKRGDPRKIGNIRKESEVNGLKLEK